MAQPSFVQSILDTDLYKLTMQQAVLNHFPDVRVKYRFTNRSRDMRFSRDCYNLMLQVVSGLGDLSPTPSECEWLRKTCPFFSPSYITYLSNLRFKPSEQVHVHLRDEVNGAGQIEIEVEGLWAETILYEVPLMAILSESYFKTVDVDWNMEGQEELAYQKGKTLLQTGAAFSEFGTRRRRSYAAHETVLRGLIRARDEFEGKCSVLGKLTGTSNVHFAHRFGLTPVGTIAHEWTMGIAAIHGVEHSNGIGLKLWEEVYPTTRSNVLHIALTDTFTSDLFFKDFTADPGMAQRWRGLRNDSGDPVAFVTKAKEAYQSIGIDWTKKVIVFSDGLDVDRCVELQKICKDAGFIPAFGVGTFLTNDFHRAGGEVSKPLNIVIKLAELEGKPCVKISDELSKNTGDPDAVKDVKRLLGIKI